MRRIISGFCLLLWVAFGGAVPSYAEPGLFERVSKAYERLAKEGRVGLPKKPTEDMSEAELQEVEEWIQTFRPPLPERGEGGDSGRHLPD